MFDSHSEEEREKEISKGKTGKGKAKGKRGKAGKDGEARAEGKGRMDENRQPMVKKPQVVSERLDDLVELHVKAQSAAEKAKNAVTKCGEDSGFLASSINKLVRAKAGDKFEEKHREVEQQKELFDEVAA